MNGNLLNIDEMPLLLLSMNSNDILFEFAVNSCNCFDKGTNSLLFVSSLDTLRLLTKLTGFDVSYYIKMEM